MRGWTRRNSGTDRDSRDGRGRGRRSGRGNACRQRRLSRVPREGMRMDHEAFMRRALELAERGRGLTSPNPVVGAVVARDGRVVGEGWHEGPGTPHAEAAALASAGASAEGATLYVTLEPCDHQGRTP